MARIAERAEVEAATGSGRERLGRVQRDVRPTRSPTGSPAPITHAAWQAAARRRRDGDPVLHAQRTHGAGDGPLPARRPADRRCRPTRARCDALTLSWGVEPVQVEEYTTTDEMVWFAVETAVQHGCVDARRHRRSCSPARPIATAARRPTCCASCGSRDAVERGIWSDEAGDRRRAAGRARPRLDGPLGRAAQAVAAGSTTDYRVLRYDRRGYGRSTPHAGPFDDGRRRSTTSSTLLAGRPAVCSATATAATSRWRSADRHPELVARPSPCTRRRCRGSTWWPARRPARRHGTTASATRPTPPSGSCAG